MLPLAQPMLPLEPPTLLPSAPLPRLALAASMPAVVAAADSTAEPACVPTIAWLMLAVRVISGAFDAALPSQLAVTYGHRVQRACRFALRNLATSTSQKAPPSSTACFAAAHAASASASVRIGQSRESD
jgi:hypothetical protein